MVAMEMRYMFDLSIIIPVYNNEKELNLTIDALKYQTLPKDKFEIIIADDGSTDDMQKNLKTIIGDEIKFKYFYQEDRGFCPGTARNMGIRNSQGKVCLFLDCGVLPAKDCLQQHVDYHQSGYDVVLGYIYGMEKDPDYDSLVQIIESNTVEDAIIILEKLNMTDPREILYAQHGDELYRWSVPWVALWSLHFSVDSNFLKNNEIYFDDYFTTWGCEDNDFGVLLSNHNAKYMLARNACSIHYPALVSSYKKLTTIPEFKENFMHNREYVYKKYPGNKGVELWYNNSYSMVNSLYDKQ